MGQKYEIAMETGKLDEYQASRAGKYLAKEQETKKEYRKLAQWLFKKIKQFESKIDGYPNSHTDKLFIEIMAELTRHKMQNNIFDKFCNAWHRHIPGTCKTSVFETEDCECDLKKT
jgi:hypothetical protein